jgi:hypothetical protein
MPREIRQFQTPVTTAAAPTPPDDFKNRLVKLIPSEIVAAYITIQGIIAGAAVSGNKDLLIWIVFLVLLILTPVYLFKITRVRKVEQIVFTTLAFVIWVIATGSPVKEIAGFEAGFIGSILLVLYTTLIPLFYKG